MATSAYWFDDFTTLDLKIQDGTDIPAAGIQGVTIVPSTNIEHLFTADSIKADTRKQDEFTVDVQIDYSLWDITVLQEWMSGDSSPGTPPISQSDTSDPATFKIDGVFNNADASAALNATVEDITFEEMPVVDGSRGEFVEWGLEGTGEDLTGVESTTP